MEWMLLLGGAPKEASLRPDMQARKELAQSKLEGRQKDELQREG